MDTSSKSGPSSKKTVRKVQKKTSSGKSVATAKGGSRAKPTNTSPATTQPRTKEEEQDIQDVSNWQFTVGTALLMGDLALAEEIIQSAEVLKVLPNTVSMLRRMVVRARSRK